MPPARRIGLEGAWHGTGGGRRGRVELAVECAPANGRIKLFEASSSEGRERKTE